MAESDETLEDFANIAQAEGSSLTSYAITGNARLETDKRINILYISRYMPSVPHSEFG